MGDDTFKKKQSFNTLLHLVGTGWTFPMFCFSAQQSTSDTCAWLVSHTCTVIARSPSLPSTSVVLHPTSLSTRLSAARWRVPTQRRRAWRSQHAAISCAWREHACAIGVAVKPCIVSPLISFTRALMHTHENKHNVNHTRTPPTSTHAHDAYRTQGVHGTTTQTMRKLGCKTNARRALQNLIS
jgi:hypothetical protein